VEGLPEEMMSRGSSYAYDFIAELNAAG